MAAASRPMSGSTSSVHLPLGVYESYKTRGGPRDRDDLARNSGTLCPLLGNSGDTLEGGVSGRTVASKRQATLRQFPCKWLLANLRIRRPSLDHGRRPPQKAALGVGRRCSASCRRSLPCKVCSQDGNNSTQQHADVMPVPAWQRSHGPEPQAQVRGFHLRRYRTAGHLGDNDKCR